jgi:hypothetical protein
MGAAGEILQSMDEDDEIPGGDSRRFDGPLWAADFVVPDDISELADEVAAYRQEQQLRARAERRATFTSWRRAGLVAPIVAVLLLCATVAGSLLVSLQPRALSPAAAREPLSRTRVVPGRVGGLLPDVRASAPAGSVLLRNFRPALLALVPADCGCAAVLDRLAGQAGEVGVPLVVVASGGATAQLSGLVAAMHVGTPVALGDPTGVLARTYHARGVTAVLVGPDGRVPFAPVRDVSLHTDLEGQLFALLPPVG